MMLGSVETFLTHLVATSKESFGHQTASTPNWARRHGCARWLQGPRHATRWFNRSRQQSGQIAMAWSCRDTSTSIVSSSSSTSCSAAAGFHHSRLAATPAPSTRQLLRVLVREAVTDEELWACARLRSVSFHVFPPERAFAGLLHQQNMAKEEFNALRDLRDAATAARSQTRGTCLIAVTEADSCPDLPQDFMLPEGKAVVGSLDLCNVRAVSGEVLMGNSSNVAYLANVCVAEAARRCSVGGTLLVHARGTAQQWGVDELLVHIMAANQSGLQFYESHGFYVIKLETADQAHRRGHCLDGISGGGRTLLLKDDLLRSDSAAT